MDHDGWTATRLLSPLGCKEFISEYWERAPFFLQRDTRGYFESLLTRGDVDDVLATGRLSVDELRLVRRDDVLGWSDYGRHGTASNGSAGEVDVWAVADQYRNGASLVLKSLDKRQPALARLCARLSATFHARVWANVYVTPGSSQALERHYDTHDVFVLQIDGQKTWQVYDVEVSWPTADQEVVPPSHELSELLTCRLNAGDVLYIPRGYVHEASTEAGPSTHITIAVETTTWAELFGEFIQMVAKQEPSLRRSVPLANTGEMAEVKATWRELLDKLHRFEPTLLEACQRSIELKAKALAELTPGPLSLEDSLSEIGDETVVSRRDGMRYSLAAEQDKLIIQHDERQITLPVVLTPIVECLLSGDDVRLAELSELMDAGSRDHLVRTLLRERVLTLGAARENGIDG